MAYTHRIPSEERVLEEPHFPSSPLSVHSLHASFLSRNKTAKLYIGLARWRRQVRVEAAESQQVDEMLQRHRRHILTFTSRRLANIDLTMGFNKWRLSYRRAARAAEEKVATLQHQRFQRHGAALASRIVWRCSDRALGRAISRWRIVSLCQGDADLRRALSAAVAGLLELRQTHITLETYASSSSSRVDAFVQKARRRRHRFERPALLLVMFHHADSIRRRATRPILVYRGHHADSIQRRATRSILEYSGHRPAAA